MTTILDLETICSICLQQQNFLISVFERDEIAKMTIAEKIERCSELKLENKNTPNKICMSCINDLSVVWRFRQNCQTASMVFRNLLKHGQKQNEVPDSPAPAAAPDKKLDNQSKKVFGQKSRQILQSNLQIRKISQMNAGISNNKDKSLVDSSVVVTIDPSSIPVKLIAGTTAERENDAKSEEHASVSGNEYEEYFEIEQMDEDGEKNKTAESIEDDGQGFYYEDELSEDTSTFQANNPQDIILKQESESQREIDDEYANESMTSAATPTSEYENAANASQIESQHDQQSVNLIEAGDTQKQFEVVYKRTRGRPRSVILNSSEAAVSKGTSKSLDDKKYKNSRLGKICEICGNVYKYRHALETHMRRHENVKPFVCEFCDKAFVAGVELQRHMRVHTGQKPYGCRYCDRRFSDFGSRIKHERTHTGERPYKCRLCGKSFAYPHVLSVHERAHLGEKRFPCTLCSKGFTKKAYLLTHMENHKRSLEYSCMIEESEEEQVRNTSPTANNENDRNSVILPDEIDQDDGEIEGDIDSYIVEQEMDDGEEDNVTEIKFESDYTECAQSN